jgi:hypothetical protein
MHHCHRKIANDAATQRWVNAIRNQQRFEGSTDGERTHDPSIGDREYAKSDDACMVKIAPTLVMEKRKMPPEARFLSIYAYFICVLSYHV